MTQNDLSPDMSIELVVAAAENDVIGLNGEMPWRLPGDLKHFKNITRGHSVIMGRKTWESIGRPLPDRLNIVMTRDPLFSANGAEVVADMQSALALSGGGRVMIIGGGEIYKMFEAYASIVHLTRVHAAPKGDTFFTLTQPDKWQELDRVFNQADAGETYDYSFITLGLISA
jgi:dihydrofolate reductase